MTPEVIEDIKNKNCVVYRLAGILGHIDFDQLSAEIVADYVKGIACVIQDYSGDLMQYLDDLTIGR